jgi:hypothetical protein
MAPALALIWSALRRMISGFPLYSRTEPVTSTTFPLSEPTSGNLPASSGKITAAKGCRDKFAHIEGGHP